MHNRVVVETRGSQGLVERHMVCPKCGSSVQLLHDTLTLATQFRLECAPDKCNFVDCGADPSRAKVGDDDDNRERSTDCAVNVLCGVATIANGDDGTEVSRLLGFLSLPRPATMSGCNFATMEDEIAPVIAQS